MFLHTQAGRKSSASEEKVLDAQPSCTKKNKIDTIIKIFISLDILEKKLQSKALISLTDCSRFQHILSVETAPWRKDLLEEKCRNQEAAKPLVLPVGINYLWGTLGVCSGGTSGQVILNLQHLPVAGRTKQLLPRSVYYAPNERYTIRGMHS